MMKQVGKSDRSHSSSQPHVTLKTTSLSNLNQPPFATCTVSFLLLLLTPISLSLSFPYLLSPLKAAPLCYPHDPSFWPGLSLFHYNFLIYSLFEFIDFEVNKSTEIFFFVRSISETATSFISTQESLQVLG